MAHLLIAYEILLVIIGFLTLVFLFLGRKEKGYLIPFSLFYLIFSLIFFLTLIRTYFLTNIPWTSAYYVYLSHGITTILNYLLLFFGIKTLHKLIEKERNLLERISAIILIISAFLMISPLSLIYLPESESISLKGFYYAATFPYLLALAYMTFSFLGNSLKIEETVDRIFSLLMGLLSLSGFIETMMSLMGDLKNPVYRINTSGQGVIFASLPYLILSLYIIFLIIRGFGKRGSEPTEEVLLSAGYSPRETDVIYLIIKGFPNQKIADELCISMATVKTHINNIFKKSNVSNRFELAKKLENM